MRGSINEIRVKGMKQLPLKVLNGKKGWVRNILRKRNYKNKNISLLKTLLSKLTF